MEPTRIVGADVKTALRMVRDQLGPDAMILSNRRVSGGVEILAVSDSWQEAEPPHRDAVPPAPAPRVEPVLEEEGYLAVSRPRIAAVPPAAAARAATTASAPAEREQLSAMHSELRGMRGLLERQLAELRIGRAAAGDGVAGRVWRGLVAAGFPQEIVREIVAGIASDADMDVAWGGVARELCRQLRDAGDLVSGGGMFALVGPTGAGKTTTLCKLAVRHALVHGPDGIAFVSLDAERIGGSDLLRTMARLLGVECRTPAGDEPLDAVLRDLRDKQLVLIDTAGVNRRVRRHVERLEELGELCDRVRTLQVLPANVQLSSLQAGIADYARARPVAAVVTKLDETRSLGEVLGVLGLQQLPLAYTTDGQDIPDDLRVARSAEVIEQALALGSDEDHDADDGVTVALSAAAGAVGVRFDPASGVNAARIA